MHTLTHADAPVSKSIRAEHTRIQTQQNVFPLAVKRAFQTWLPLASSQVENSKQTPSSFSSSSSSSFSSSSLSFYPPIFFYFSSFVEDPLKHPQTKIDKLIGGNSTCRFPISHLPPFLNFKKKPGFIENRLLWPLHFLDETSQKKFFLGGALLRLFV